MYFIDIICDRPTKITQKKKKIILLLVVYQMSKNVKQMWKLLSEEGLEVCSEQTTSWRPRNTLGL